MIMLLLAVLVSLGAPAAAQSTLQLPDVTLFGEYTLYLATPPPLNPGVPEATGMSDDRLSYPRTFFKVDLAEPRPPRIYWQRIPRSVLAPPGLLPDSAGNEAAGYAGEGQAVASGGWQARVDYVPGDTVLTGFTATRSSGVWDLSGMLDFNLADGWITTPPDSPTDLTFWVQSRRRAEVLNIDAALGVGAYYGPGSAAQGASVYTVGLDAGLYGEAGVFQWSEESRLCGISGIGGGIPPADPDEQRGAVQQNVELALSGSRWDLSLESGGVLAAGLPSADTEKSGRMTLELGWRHPKSTLRLWAGGAVLYYDESLEFFPSGGLELYPTDFSSLSLRAAPFVRLPARALQALCAVRSVSAGSAVPQLRSEGGYSLLSELRFDPGATFAAAFSFEWIDGRIYLLDTSDREISFIDTNQGILRGDLIWQMRAGRPGIRLNLSGQAAAGLPLSATPWRELLYSRCGLVWTTDFHKLPVEFIIKALIGDFADDGSGAFLFTDWEIISSLVTSIEVNWKIGKNGAVHTGFEAFLTPNFSYRFLIGYGVRR